MKRIIIYQKEGLEIPEALKKALRKSLFEKGVEIVGPENPEGAEAIVVLGGDGTFLRATPLAYRLDLPLLGINLGRLGFLTEVSLEEAELALSALVAGKLQIEKRLLLEVEHQREVFYVLNEVAVLKGPLGRMIHLSVFAQREYLTTYYGDGLIVATPTGSTAYNLSAGGPIIHPQTSAVVLTPVCPFMLSARPLVLPSEMEIEIELASPSPEVHILLDGNLNLILEPHERFKIKKAKRFLKLLTSPTRSYFEILRTKLGWGKIKL